MSLKKVYTDTETTGTNPYSNGVHQITMLMTIDNQEVDELDLRIQPYETDELTDEALEVGGVTKEQLFSPMRLLPAQALSRVNSFLGKHIDKFNRSDKAFFIGYKAAFDHDFLRQFWLKGGDNYFGSWFWTPALDVMTLSGYLLQRERPNIENFKLRTVWEYLNAGPGNYSEEDWHDSMFDIKRTREVEDWLRQIVLGVRRKTSSTPLPPEPK